MAELKFKKKIGKLKKLKLKKKRPGELFQGVSLVSTLWCFVILRCRHLQIHDVHQGSVTSQSKYLVIRC